jgi:hypothetical protein
MDWSPLLQAGIALATAALPVIAGKLWFWLDEKIKASALERLADAAKRGAGQVIAEMAAQPATAAAVANLQAAVVAAAAETIATSFSGTLAKLGGTRETVSRMVTGELGKLLAASPTLGPARPAP